MYANIKFYHISAIVKTKHQPVRFQETGRMEIYNHTTKCMNYKGP